MLTVLLFGAIWIGVVAFLRLKKRRGFVYLAFLTAFYVYLFKVVDYTLLQFQALVVMRFFTPNLILRGHTAEESVNLVPLVTLGPQDLETSLLNVLLMVPFGFGLPFVTDWHVKKVFAVGVLFSVAIEVLQLVTGAVSGVAFRVADINDVIFNAMGVAIGCALFVGFGRVFRRVVD